MGENNWREWRLLFVLARERNMLERGMRRKMRGGQEEEEGRGG